VYSSGQRGQTVNLLAYAYEGSNPSARIMFHEFNNPIPVVTPLGEGYAIYIRDGGTFENDIWCVTLKNGGEVKHFTTKQIKIWLNGTFEINNK